MKNWIDYNDEISEFWEKNGAKKKKQIIPDCEAHWGTQKQMRLEKHPQCESQCAIQWGSQNHMKRAINQVPMIFYDLFKSFWSLFHYCITTQVKVCQTSKGEASVIFDNSTWFPSKGFSVSFPLESPWLPTQASYDVCLAPQAKNTYYPAYFASAANWSSGLRFS